MPPMDDYEDSEDDEDDEDDSDYDLSPDESELREEYDEDVSDSEDALDDLDEPRITEVDEEDAPALVAAPAKGKNKRVAEDDSMVDASMASATSATSDADKPLSKSQKKKLAKKLKDNSGNAVEAPKTEEPASASKSDKKVQFKEGLVQGPTPSGNASTETKETKETKESKSASGPRTVGGVTIDDRKVGSGPGAKKGDRISMRYIGKLEKDKKVFDSNKKGKPFSFVLGKGEVIKGWDIGVAGMQAGGERRLTIPAKLAYGSKAIPDIPANSTLVFDVKLLEIK
jgi:FK506-binding nuclear protein